MLTVGKGEGEISGRSKKVMKEREGDRDRRSECGEGGVERWRTKMESRDSLIKVTRNEMGRGNVAG